jgi:predicted transcriptional regulator of viral defense system
MDQWLTVDEVAELQGLADRTVRQQAQAGRYKTRLERASSAAAPAAWP